MNALQPSDGSKLLVPLKDPVALRIELAYLKEGAASRPFLFYMAFVAIVVTTYYLLIAAPLYVSQSQFTVRGKSVAVSVPILAAFTGQDQGGVTDSDAVANYIQSGEMLQALDRSDQLRKQYSSFRLDFLNHMPANATPEDFLAFYNKMINVSVDSDSNIITVKVISVNPQAAYSVNQAILKNTSAYVDNLSRKIRDEATRAAQQDLQKAMHDVIVARGAVTAFRQRTGVIDPNSYGQVAAGAAMSLEQQIYALRMQRASLLTYSTPGSPQVQQVDAQIAALQREIGQVNASLSGASQVAGMDSAPSVPSAGQTGKPLVKDLNEYQGLFARQVYAEQRLAVTQANYDQALSAAEQKSMFVVPVTNPNLPGKPTMPARIINILGALLLAAVTYAICKLAILSIRDHQN